jgi:hypothetical protein
LSLSSTVAHHFPDVLGGLGLVVLVGGVEGHDLSVGVLYLGELLGEGVVDIRVSFPEFLGGDVVLLEFLLEFGELVDLAFRLGLLDLLVEPRRLVDDVDAGVDGAYPELCSPLGLGLPHELPAVCGHGNLAAHVVDEEVDYHLVALAPEELCEAVPEDAVPGVPDVEGGVGVGAGVLHHHFPGLGSLDEAVFSVFLDHGAQDESCVSPDVHLEVDVTTDGSRRLDQIGGRGVDLFRNVLGDLGGATPEGPRELEAYGRRELPHLGVGRGGVLGPGESGPRVGLLCGLFEEALALLSQLGEGV